MTAEEYAEQQAAINAALVVILQQLLSVFRAPTLSIQDWWNLLDIVYPYVEAARTESAELGRRFFDAQRSQHHPDLPRHNAYLAKYDVIWFREAMEPVRQALSKPGASSEAVSQFALRALKEVENGGRRTIIRAVASDPVARRWARVATGRETCEFCLTMISRGPVYLDAQSAGLNTDDTTAVGIWRRAQGTGEAAYLASVELDELMTKWHAGCDCKVVPVFNFKNWPGREAYLRAEKVWNKYARMVDNDPDLLKPQNGNQHGKNLREWSRSEAIMAAIRRAIANGELDMNDYAIAA